MEDRGDADADLPLRVVQVLLLGAQDGQVEGHGSQITRRHVELGFDADSRRCARARCKRRTHEFR